MMLKRLLTNNLSKNITKRLYSSVPLTSASYPNIVRNQFSELDPIHIHHLKGIVDTNNSITDPSELSQYNEDWVGKLKGQSTLLVKPNCSEQVVEVLQYCNENNIAVVPQGGNTGLVGGSTPVFDELIVNLSKLDKVIDFDPTSGILVCEAGCILDNLNQYLNPLGFMMPIDLGAKGSCHIGGNLATNAGGLRLLRYGSLHGNTLGLEVVLPDGTILDNLSTLRKDNTGSEGTLGIITKVAILCAPLPKSVNVVLLGLESYANILKLFQTTKANLAEILSAFEFLDTESMQTVQSFAHLKAPLDKSYPFYVLIETHGSNPDHDNQKLDELLTTVLESGIASDGIVAQDDTQRDNLWKYREFVPEAISKAGKAYKFDLSVPVPNLYHIVKETRVHLKDQNLLKEDGSGLVSQVTGYGHLGDGNLHLNVIATKVDPSVNQALEPFIYQLTSQFRGSISAEHGLGLQKAKYLGYSKDATSISIMKRIKDMFDPNGILNPYKYLP